MVALTPNRAYPYPVGTDRPCDSPAVWCELVAALEADLLGLDSRIGRLAPAVPVAKVVRTTDIILVVGALDAWAPIPFEFVEYDTDNMVDLTRDAFRISGARSGHYYATGWAQVQGGTPGNIMATFVTTGFVAPSSSSASQIARDDIRVPGAGSNYYLRAGGFARNHPSFDPLLVGLTVSPIPSPATIIVMRAELSLYWVTDRFSNL